MRFKIDENLPVEVAAVLRQAGHDVMTIHDQRMVGQTDPTVASVCQSEGRAIMTLDLDFADIRAYPPADHPGIIVLRPRNQAKQTVIELAEQLLPHFESELLERKLWLVQGNKLRIREG